MERSSVWETLLEHQRNTAQALQTLSTLNTVHPDPLRGEVLLKIDKLTLHYYAPSEPRSDAPPLLICYALVNRPYILDLEPKRSLIRDLVSQGIPVYLIDWGYPDLTDRHLTLEDYLLDYLDSCVQRLCEHAGTSVVNLMGVCQGGVFALLYAALKPDRVSKLVTLVTPVDASVDQFTLAQMIRKVDLKRLISVEGNLPGTLLNQVYAALRPLQLSIYKQLKLAENVSNPERAALFLRMEHWLNDTPDLAGAAARQFAEQFFQGNALCRDQFCINNEPVSLKTISAPVLNIYGLQDYLVPPESSRALGRCLNPSLPYSELALSGGHIGAFTSHRNRDRIVKAVQAWLAHET